MARTCTRCGTEYRPDEPHAVRCLGCGARQRHPAAVDRPREFLREAMTHYSSDRSALEGHRVLSSVAGLAVVLVCAVGVVYLVDIVPGLDVAGVLERVGRFRVPGT